MSEYRMPREAAVVGGKLKLKGAPLPTGGHRKKKKSTKGKVKMAAIAEDLRPTDAIVPATPTKAEIEFRALQASKEKLLVKKMAEKTHREKIEEYNKKLANLSEHYDVPKVGPG
ncbi:protein FAM32A [Pelomyxa schiedti]|nr:protein FAM32A [Pelomyxa schiedti]